MVKQNLVFTWLICPRQDRTESALPYGNIVALNTNGSTLHYQHQLRQHPQDPQSLLIDAGGEYRGYASDITRTHAQNDPQHQTFDHLIKGLDRLQQNIVAEISIGKTFTDLHTYFHQQLAELLVEQEILKCTSAQAYDQRLTESFCPHGLGHLLGLQVHDVGGHLANEQGDLEPPPENFLHCAIPGV